MRRDSEDWLDKRIAEDMAEIDDALMQELMEEAKREQVKMPRERLDAIHEEVARRKAGRTKGRIHLRVALVAAAVMVLLIGGGVVTSGERVYIPEIFQRERGDEITTKVNNAEVVPSEYDEEAVCQEIEEKLGVIPVRFGYRPKGLEITEYYLYIESKEAILRYQFENFDLHIYISKDYAESSVNYQNDGEILEEIFVEACNMQIPIYKIDDSDGGEFYSVEFEFLNTYYTINGIVEEKDFYKIIENIYIKNA